MAPNHTNLNAELRALLAGGRKIEAIKRYREATGAELAAAKEAVEALEQGGETATAAQEPADSSLQAQIVSLLQSGKKTEAVKVYRERTGTGLKEAKEAVEAIAADRQIVTSSGSGCLGGVLLAGAILALSVASSVFALAADTAKPEARKLTFDTFSGYFVSNKFEPDAAVSFVVIHNQGQFDKVFGVAFVMGDKSHRLPKDAFKSNLVLAAIKRGKAVWEYEVEQVTEAKGVVEVRYTATEKKSPSATFACPLIVSIPKGKYARVQFIENGKPVKAVEIEAGQPPRRSRAGIRGTRE